MVKTAPCRLLHSSLRNGFGEELKMEFKGHLVDGLPKRDGQRRRRLPHFVGFLYIFGDRQFLTQLFNILNNKLLYTPVLTNIHAPSVSEFFTIQFLRLQIADIDNDFIFLAEREIVAEFKIILAMKGPSPVCPGFRSGVKWSCI